MTDVVDIDGKTGEGGGQVLRTSLALSLVTGKPFRMRDIRAKRERGGLLRQHLTCVRAATAIGDAIVTGDVLGSKELAFRPLGIRGGDHEAAVGSAGSAMLVLQTVLPALLFAGEPSSIVVRGGTHNLFAPPWDFLAHVWFPLLKKAGARVTGELERSGFHPAGGGVARVAIEPSKLEPFDLLTRGAHVRTSVTARVAGVPRRIAEGEAAIVATALGIADRDRHVEELPQAHGPGNVVFATIEHENGAEIVAGFGERGVPLERVAGGVVTQALAFLGTDAPVGVHLADQLVLLLALAGGGRFRTLPLDLHTTTQLAIIPRFLPVRFDVTEEAGGTVLIAVNA